MTDLKSIIKSLRAAVDVGDLGAIASGVEALEGLTGLRQTHRDESDLATISSGHNDAERVRKCWEFTLQTRGYGETPEDAWEDAVDTISGDLGGYLSLADLPYYQRCEKGDEIDDILYDDEAEEAAEEGGSW